MQQARSSPSRRRSTSRTRRYPTARSESRTTSGSRWTTGSGTAPIEFSISSGSLPPGLAIQNYGERFAEIQGTPTQAGTWNFYLQAKDSQCCPFYTQEQRSITITDRLVISTQSLPDAPINQPYGPIQLTASGGTVDSWTVTSGALPAGVTLSSTGVIQGTPTASGAFTFTVQAASSLGPDTKQLTIFVIAPLVLGGPGAVPYKTEPVQLSWKVNEAVNWGVAATGGRGPYTYTSTTLPVGLTLNPDGTLTGASTTAGVFPVTFTVTDAAAVVDTLKTVINIKALLAFGAAKPPTGKLGKASAGSSRSRVPARSSCSSRAASTRPGLELDEATGVLSGTPLKTGSYKVKFWVSVTPARRSPSATRSRSTSRQPRLEPARRPGAERARAPTSARVRQVRMELCTRFAASSSSPPHS